VLLGEAILKKEHEDEDLNKYSTKFQPSINSQL